LATSIALSIKTVVTRLNVRSEMNRSSTAILADLSVKDGLVSKPPDLDALFR
jgi:hypothetical protein